MPYTSELNELIKRVEATRPARVETKRRGEEFPLLSLKDRQVRLEKFHPDYIRGARVEVRVGPSKGYEIQPEMVRLLEARSRINPDLIDLNWRRGSWDSRRINGSGEWSKGFDCDETEARRCQYNDGRRGDPGCDQGDKGFTLLSLSRCTGRRPL